MQQNNQHQYQVPGAGLNGLGAIVPPVQQQQQNPPNILINQVHNHVAQDPYANINLRQIVDRNDRQNENPLQGQALISNIARLISKQTMNANHREDFQWIANQQLSIGNAERWVSTASVRKCSKVNFPQVSKMVREYKYLKIELGKMCRSQPADQERWGLRDLELYRHQLTLGYMPLQDVFRSNNEITKANVKEYFVYLWDMSELLDVLFFDKFLKMINCMDKKVVELKRQESAVGAERNPQARQVLKRNRIIVDEFFAKLGKEQEELNALVDSRAQTLGLMNFNTKQICTNFYKMIKQTDQPQEMVNKGNLCSKVFQFQMMIRYFARRYKVYTKNKTGNRQKSVQRFGGPSNHEDDDDTDVHSQLSKSPLKSARKSNKKNTMERTQNLVQQCLHENFDLGDEHVKQRFIDKILKLIDHDLQNTLPTKAKAQQRLGFQCIANYKDLKTWIRGNDIASHFPSMHNISPNDRLYLMLMMPNMLKTEDQQLYHLNLPRIAQGLVLMLSDFEEAHLWNHVKSMELYCATISLVQVLASRWEQNSVTILSTFNKITILYVHFGLLKTWYSAMQNSYAFSAGDSLTFIGCVVSSYTPHLRNLCDFLHQDLFTDSVFGELNNQKYYGKDAEKLAELYQFTRFLLPAEITEDGLRSCFYVLTELFQKSRFIVEIAKAGMFPIASYILVDEIIPFFTQLDKQSFEDIFASNLDPTAMYHAFFKDLQDKHLDFRNKMSHRMPEFLRAGQPQIEEQLAALFVFDWKAIRPNIDAIMSTFQNRYKGFQKRSLTRDVVCLLLYQLQNVPNLGADQSLTLMLECRAGSGKTYIMAVLCFFLIQVQTDDYHPLLVFHNYFSMSQAIAEFTTVFKDEMFKLKFMVVDDIDQAIFDEYNRPGTFLIVDECDSVLKDQVVCTERGPQYEHLRGLFWLRKLKFKLFVTATITVQMKNMTERYFSDVVRTIQIPPVHNMLSQAQAEPKCHTISPNNVVSFLDGYKALKIPLFIFSDNYKRALGYYQQSQLNDPKLIFDQNSYNNFDGDTEDEKKLHYSMCQDRIKKLRFITKGACIFSELFMRCVNIMLSLNPQVLILIFDKEKLDTSFYDQVIGRAMRECGKVKVEITWATAYYGTNELKFLTDVFDKAEVPLNIDNYGKLFAKIEEFSQLTSFESLCEDIRNLSPVDFQNKYHQYLA